MYLLKSLFKKTKIKLTNWILSITILIIVTASFFHKGIDSNNFFNLLNLWQLIVMFGLQAIINQKLITKTIKIGNNRNYGGFDYVRIHSELLTLVLNRKLTHINP